MTDEELKAIEEHAAHAAKADDWYDCPTCVENRIALIAEVKRLRQPLRCTACGAPPEAHAPDEEDATLWKVWITDTRYPLWGTPHGMHLRRLGAAPKDEPQAYGYAPGSAVMEQIKVWKPREGE